MSILYVYEYSFKSYNGCHGNHELSYNQNAFIFEDNIFLHLSGNIKQIYTHNQMSYVFNVQLLSKIFIESDFCHNYLHTLYLFKCL